MHLNLITSAEGFFALLLALMAIIFTLEKKYPDSKFFKIIPGMLWLMYVFSRSQETFAYGIYSIITKQSASIINPHLLEAW